MPASLTVNPIDRSEFLGKLPVDNNDNEKSQLNPSIASLVPARYSVKVALCHTYVVIFLEVSPQTVSMHIGIYPRVGGQNKGVCHFKTMKEKRSEISVACP